MKDYINDALHLLVASVILLPLVWTPWYAPVAAGGIGLYRELAQERATEKEQKRTNIFYDSKSHWQILKTMGRNKWRDVAWHVPAGVIYTALAVFV